MRTRFLLLATLLLLGAGLGGCNTIEGAGKDVKATGNAVEKAADDAKKKVKTASPFRSQPVSGVLSPAGESGRTQSARHLQSGNVFVHIGSRT